MIKNICSIVSGIICVAFMLTLLQGCGGGGGGGAGGGATASKSVRPKTVLEGAIGTTVKGIDITLTLPPGMSVSADASGVVSNGVITLLSPNDTSSYSAASYIPASRKLTIGVIRGAAPFSPGDFFSITCDVEAGVSSQNMVISVDRVRGFDNLGAEITPMPTATASL